MGVRAQRTLRKNRWRKSSEVNSGRGLRGVGIGLRTPHTARILAERVAIDWLEILYENFQADGGPAPRILERIRANYEIAFHCVALDIGTTDPPDSVYLDRLRSACARYAPEFVSAHLCWTGVAGARLHDLLPLPYTEAALGHVSGRIDQVQEFLGRRILVENVSAYLRFAESEMKEGEFCNEVARCTGCGILLDVNNLHVNAVNHGDDAREAMNAIEPRHVSQMHLAGFEDRSEYLLDTHGAPVPDVVWELYTFALARFGPVPVAIERDQNIPSLDELLAERDRAAALMDRVVHGIA